MKTPAPVPVHALLLAALVALAGCADESVPGASDAVADAAGPESTAGNQTAPADPDAVVLTLDATTLVVQGGNATLRGTVSHPAVVNVAHANGSDSFDADGAWSHTYDAPFGHDEVTVTADDGTTTANATVLVQRNMVVTVEVEHGPASGLEDTTHTFYWDFGGLRSLHEDESYQGCEQPHPGRPNAHDMLLDYEDASGLDVGFSECGSFGVNIETVHGADNTTFWCFQVNGETAEFGVSLLELADGDVFTFLDCNVAF